MIKLALAALLLLSGSALLLVSARSFRDIKVNLGIAVTALLFFGQATVLLGQITFPKQPAATSAQASGSPAASPDPASLAWDQGGTLQRASYEDWRMGSYADRLASAADLLKGLRREQVFVAPIRSEQDYRPWAAALVACLESSGAEAGTAVAQLARRCAAEDRLKQYLR